MSEQPYFARTAMQTVFGTHFDYADILNQDINIVEVAHVLARNCRYNGHVESLGTETNGHAYIYSVAAHSCLVHDLMVYDKLDDHGHANPNMPNRAPLHGLLHDAGEAFVSDLPRPLKMYLRDVMDFDVFAQMEHDVIQAICTKYHIPMADEQEHEQVSFYDNLALMIERDAVQVRTTHEWGFPPQLIGEYNARKNELRAFATWYFDDTQDWRKEFLIRWNDNLSIMA